MPTPPTNAGRRFPPVAYTDDQIRAVLDAIPAKSNTGIRLRALVAVLYGSGLRVGEALDLRPSDVRGTQIHVRAGKGGKDRVVGIDPASLALLQVWTERRAALGVDGRAPLFCGFGSRAGEPWDQREVRRALARVGSLVGLERLHPHSLRHSHAVRAASTGDVRVAQRQLGHASLHTTTTYLDHLDAGDLSTALASLGDWTQPKAPKEFDRDAALARVERVAAALGLS
jgi:integrase